VRMVWTKLGQRGGDVDPVLGCLARLQVVDQAKFPFIVGESTVQDLSHCEVYSKSGDFADLTWLSDAINHGNAINWEHVREVWKKHFISSSQEFSHLLSVCPDPGACLDSVAPKNLCILIEGEDGSTIAESCVQFSSKEGDAITDPNSVFYTASWNLLKNAPDQFEKLHVNKLDTLLWASQFAFSLMRVKENNIGTTARLQQALVDVSRSLKPEDDDKLALLWSHLFAGLLVVGERGISNSTALILSRKVSPIPSEWPELIKLLSQVGDRSATYAQLEKLYDSGFFARNEGPEPCVPDAQFAARLLELPTRTLSARWQVAILTSDITLPDSAASKLEEGLRTIDDPRKIRIKGAAGDALRKLASEKNVG